MIYANFMRHVQLNDRVVVHRNTRTVTCLRSNHNKLSPNVLQLTFHPALERL